MARKDDPLDNLTDQQAGLIRQYLRYYAGQPEHHALVRYLHNLHGAEAWREFGLQLPESWGPGALEEDPRPRAVHPGLAKDPTPSYQLQASSPEEVSKKLYAAGLELQRLIIGRASRLGVGYDEAQRSLEQERQAGSVMKYVRSRPPAPRTPEEYQVAQRKAISLATRSGGALGYDEALQRVLAG
jgi:hypothetical protein